MRAVASGVPSLAVFCLGGESWSASAGSIVCGMKLVWLVSTGCELTSSGKNHFERWLIRLGAFDEAVLEVRCESMLSMASQSVSAGPAVHEPLELDWVDIGGGISTESVSA